jgi:hypothetical protein
VYTTTGKAPDQHAAFLPFVATAEKMTEWCEECERWLRDGKLVFSTKGVMIEGEHGLFKPVSEEPLRAVYQLQARLRVLRTQGLSYVLDSAKRANAIAMDDEAYRKALDTFHHEQTERLTHHLLARWRWREEELDKQNGQSDPTALAPIRLSELAAVIFPESDPYNNSQVRRKIREEMLKPFTSMGLWSFRRHLDGFEIDLGPLLKFFEDLTFKPIACELVAVTSQKLVGAKPCAFHT